MAKREHTIGAGGSYKNLTYRIKDVYLGLIDEEGFEENGDDGGTFTEHQKGTVHPGASAMEEVQKCNLR